MKKSLKLWILLMALLVIALFVGCSSGNQANSNLTKEDKVTINVVKRDVQNKALNDAYWEIQSDPKHTTGYFVKATVDNNEEPPIWWVGSGKVYFVNGSARKYNNSVPKRPLQQFDLNTRYINELFDNRSVN